MNAVDAVRETAPTSVRVSKGNAKIRIYPDNILLKKATPVTNFDDRLTQAIIEMYATLKELGGCGLSGCQIGDPRSLFVYHLEDKQGVMVNPTWVPTATTSIHVSEEGCLSLPGVFCKVPRFTEIEVSYQDETGHPHKEIFTGRLADCLQHELDHLEGRTILNYLSRLRQDVITRKYKKFQRKLRQLERTDRNVRKQVSGVAD